MGRGSRQHQAPALKATHLASPHAGVNLMTFYVTPNERVNDKGPVHVSMRAGPRRVKG